jgi:cytosine/adenosine deaminase-related metal-dependent hydrolase
VHVNYAVPSDAELLARAGASVAHCPRSHAYFKHRSFPFDMLARAGVNICLGTDSLASMQKTRGRLPALDMFAEMRAFAEAQQNVPPDAIVRLATMNGARALGLPAGELREGALADLITLPFRGNIEAAHEAVVWSGAPVGGVMIAGEWIKQPGTPA